MIPSLPSTLRTARINRENGTRADDSRIYIGPISSIFDITTFCLLWYVFGVNSAAHESLFHSGWFVEGLLSQTLIWR